MKINILLLLLVIPNFLFSQIEVNHQKSLNKNYFTIAEGQNIAPIYCDADENISVKKTTNLFLEDLKRITGKQSQLLNEAKQLKGQVIIIGTIGESRMIDQLISSGKLDVDSIKNQWERFLIKTIDNPLPGVDKALIIAGSDRRGLSYGVFSVSEAIGVSPWYWWADVPVKKSNSLYLSSLNYASKAPSVKYRGIFINDEDWGMKPWAAKKMDTDIRDIGPKTYAKVCELLLRLKANLMWPAMHAVTGAFNKYPENKLVADTFGIVMGSSHCEPLLFNNATEWNKKSMGEWNYQTNKDGIIEQLDKRVKSNSSNENLYTLALRGLHDEGMIGNLTTAEKVKNLESALQDQRNILKKYISKPIESVPQVFIPYKEVMDLYNKGAKVPEDVTIIWPDDNYGYIKQLAAPEDLNRDGGFGVYYHVSYLGEPHNNLWLSTTPPSLIYEEMSKVYRTGADKVWVLNVGDIKACEYSTELFLEMAWDIDKYNYQSVSQNQAVWSASLFGNEYLNDFATIWDKYYHLAFTRKPEYMGWGYEWNSGAERITDTEFSFVNYREAEKRIEDYEDIAGKVTKIMTQLPEEQKPAFYQLVYYPVKASCLMNKKMLIAQKNRMYAKEGRAKTNVLAAEAKSYYDSLQMITNEYNSLLNGKWEAMMSIEQGWVSRTHIMPPVDSLKLANKAILAVFPEGAEPVKYSTSPFKALPVFNSYAPKTYFIDVANKGSKALKWEATVSNDWIKLNKTSGKTIYEQRILVSIDWQKLPANENVFGEINFRNKDQHEKIIVSVFNPQNVDQEELNGLFVEQNGYISIPAADFHRKNNTDPMDIQLIPGLGIENKSIQFGDPLKRNMDPRKRFKTSVEYDFYLFTPGWVTIQTYALPVFPLNKLEKAEYSYRIDDDILIRPNIESGEYSDDWKENVLRNFAINEHRYFIPKAGKHTFKLMSTTQGMVIQKIGIDSGGLKDSYLGPESSKIE
ncbi:MAG: glycosyl hydrolase 115 family protein [Labilibaculum antarcticum]